MCLWFAVRNEGVSIFYAFVPIFLTCHLSVYLLMLFVFR